MKIKLTNIKIYRPTTEISISEQKGKIEERKITKNKLIRNENTNQYIDKQAIETIRKTLKTHQDDTVLLTYEEYNTYNPDNKAVQKV